MPVAVLHFAFRACRELPEEVQSRAAVPVSVRISPRDKIGVSERVFARERARDRERQRECDDHAFNHNRDSIASVYGYLSGRLLCILDRGRSASSRLQAARPAARVYRCCRTCMRDARCMQESNLAKQRSTVNGCERL